MRLLPFFVFVITCAAVGFANQERLMPFARFRIETRALGGVTVDGTQNESGDITSLSIAAFGRTHTAPKAVLEQLLGCRANGIQVVSDTGIFGAYLHVKFESGFTSYPRAVRLLTLSASGEFSVRELPVDKNA